MGVEDGRFCGVGAWGGAAVAGMEGENMICWSPGPAGDLKMNWPPLIIGWGPGCIICIIWPLGPATRMGCWGDWGGMAWGGPAITGLPSLPFIWAMLACGWWLPGILVTWPGMGPGPGIICGGGGAMMKFCCWPG